MPIPKAPSIFKYNEFIAQQFCCANCLSTAWQDSDNKYGIKNFQALKFKATPFA